jgi:hypothetical protein
MAGKKNGTPEGAVSSQAEAEGGYSFTAPVIPDT